ncbi:MAG: hypothetical protein ACOZE5_14605 [Verrucomicrobiota bacterium]
MKLKATLVLLVALAGGVGTFTWRAVRLETAPAVGEPELRWLQREFALSDSATRRIAELHRRYTAECEPMCEALQTSDAELTRLVSAGKRVTPEVLSALEHSNKIVVDCQHRMLEHFYAVAGEMPPAASERYLALMIPIATHPEQSWMKLKP